MLNKNKNYKVRRTPDRKDDVYKENLASIADQ